MLQHSIVIVLTVIISKTECHTPVNSSDIVIVGGHADMHDAVFITSNPVTSSKTTPSSDSDDDFMKNGEEIAKAKEEDQKNDILFVPTDKHVFRNDETFHEDTIKMTDVLENKRPETGTESPGDILFIQGKNSERQDRPVPEFRRKNTNNEDQDREFKYIDYDDEETTTAATTTEKPLDCTDLDCDNTIDSICGGKMERSEMKYRLFKNECYFRKVNCGFSYEMNRYSEVDLNFCKNIGMHITRRPDDFPVYIPMDAQYQRPFSRKNDDMDKRSQPKRRFDGRRAMAMNLGGSFCSHVCPIICTEEYEPECALSSTGEKRVFRNHCQLDLNSCQLQMLWRRRPLAECTGGKKADMHQNRAFIDWMQRTGIVDKKGKLVLSR